MQTSHIRKLSGKKYNCPFVDNAHYAKLVYFGNLQFAHDYNLQGRNWKEGRKEGNFKYPDPEFRKWDPGSGAKLSGSATLHATLMLNIEINLIWIRIQDPYPLSSLPSFLPFFLAVGVKSRYFCTSSGEIDCLNYIF